MPDSTQYNPNILGFIDSRGPVFISLEDARRTCGRLPSEYNFVKKKKGRKPKKGLNLVVGKVITEMLKDHSINLKKAVHDFFRKWHRNYHREFGVHMAPFFNLNDPMLVKEVFDVNQQLLLKALTFDLKTELDDHRLIRKDILHSIEARDLYRTVERILMRKLKDFRMHHHIDKVSDISNVLAMIRSKRIIENIQAHAMVDLSSGGIDMLAIYADEIAEALFQLSTFLPLEGIDALNGVSGKGVEFQWASRDYTYLGLGKITGDCTADKSSFQADRDIENIYWTVFPWILDRNYQILKVFYNNVFVMKVHLLPLFVLREKGDGDMALAVDAIETVRALRDDIKGGGSSVLLEKKAMLFNTVIEKIIDIGTRMGIRHIYAEKFSNTRWVREALDVFPEIFLHVDAIIKMDELEDVFVLAQRICNAAGQTPPREIFMELQMKNTSLLPRLSERVAGVKPFAILRGRPEDGIQMKRVVGV